MKPLLQIVALTIGILLTHKTAQAASCIISTASAEARMVIDGQSKAISNGQLLTAESCNTIAVQAGTICIMHETIDRARCVAVRHGETYRNTEKSASTLSTVARMLLDLARGEPQVVKGGKRAHDQTVLPGLPYEYVLVPNGDLLIPMNFGHQGLVSEFQIENRAQRRKTALPIQSGHVRLAASLIARDAKYDWTATVGGRRYSGSFTFVDLNSEPELRDQLKAIRSAPDLSGNRAAMALAEAAALSEHNFTFDALRVITPFTPAQ